MGNTLYGKIEKPTMCECRIWKVKCKLGKYPPYISRKSKSKRIYSFYSCSVLFEMNWSLRIMNWHAPWFLVGVPPPPWIELQPMCRWHNSCRRQFMKAFLSIHATARLQFIARLSAWASRRNELMLPHHELECAMISRRRTASSMNWIATHLPKAQFMP